MYRSCAEFSQRNAFFIHLSICLFVLALHALIIKDITLSEELKVEHIELTWTRALRRRKSIFLKEVYDKTM